MNGHVLLRIKFSVMTRLAFGKGLCFLPSGATSCPRRPQLLSPSGTRECPQKPLNRRSPLASASASPIFPSFYTWAGPRRL